MTNPSQGFRKCVFAYFRELDGVADRIYYETVVESPGQLPLSSWDTKAFYKLAIHAQVTTEKFIGDIEKWRRAMAKDEEEKEANNPLRSSG